MSHMRAAGALPSGAKNKQTKQTNKQKEAKTANKSNEKAVPDNMRPRARQRGRLRSLQQRLPCCCSAAANHGS
jgi:hypothetical protein